MSVPETKNKRANFSIKRNVPRLYVQAIFALAAALALTTSACGKSDGGGAKPVPGNTTTAPASATTSNVGVVGRAANELDQTSSTSASEANSGSSGVGSVSTNENGEPELIDGLRNPKIEEEVKKPSAQSESVLESVVYYDPNGLTSDQIFNKKNDVLSNGAYLGEHVRSDISSANGEDLFYTGGGQDNLRDLLFVKVNERLAKQDPRIQKGDREFAHTIQLAKFNIDWPTRRAVLTFQLERIGSQGKRVMSYVTMEGPVDNLGRFQVKSRHAKMAAEVACMDIDGGCKTVHVRVQDRSSGQIQTAHMIARHTNATLFVKSYEPGAAKNAEYDYFVNILLDTVRRSERKQPLAPSYVQQLTMTTSETIGGASNFTVTMDMFLESTDGHSIYRGGDTVELTGPLAKPRSGDKLNVGVNVSPALTVVNGEVVSPTELGYHNRIVETISGARLVKNDGLGNLQLELTVRSATVEAKPEKLWLTIGRIHTPTSSTRIPMQ